MKNLGFCLLLTAVSPYASAREPIVLTERARELHRSALVVDGHNDLPWELRSNHASNLDRVDIARRQPALHTDLPRLREGGVGAQFWSVFVPMSTARRGEALLTTLEQIELVNTMIERYPGDLALALSADDIEARRAEGKIASLIGVEGGHCIEESLATLRLLHDRGARYMTLTHSDTLSWADSATDEHRNGGLNEFGRRVVGEMNRLGMMVDLSHVSAEVMHQALDFTTAPVIFSHSSCRAVADHPRNVPDGVLKRLPENGGVVMINFFSGFIVPAAAADYREKFAYRRGLEQRFNDDAEKIRRELDRWSAGRPPMPRGDLHDVLDHIEHAAKVAGVDHVGLGSDFDGVSVLPRQMDDVACYPLITQGLLDRGFGDEDIRKILGGNLMRVLHGVEAARKAPPVEAAAP